MNHNFKIGDIVYWNGGDNVGQITHIYPAFLNSNSITEVMILKGAGAKYSINTCYINLVTPDWIDIAEKLWISQAKSLASLLRNKITA